MKKISLMRHAEAHNNKTGRDFDRTLNDVGMIQAQEAASFLKQKYIPDFLIISDSIRTVETSKYIEDAFLKIKIAKENRIYSGNYLDIIKILEIFIASHSHIILIGHNPTIFSSTLEMADKNQGKYNDLVFSSMRPSRIITLTYEKGDNNYLPITNRGIIDSIFDAS